MVLSKYTNLNRCSKVILKLLSTVLSNLLLTNFPIEYLIYDIGSLIKTHITTSKEPNIVVIEIDDVTLQTINQYPLARHYYISALNNINNASFIVIDVLFTGYSIYDDALSKTIKGKGNLILATTLFDEELPIFYEDVAAKGHGFVPYDSNKVIRRFPQSNSLHQVTTYLYQLMGYGKIRHNYTYLVWPRKKDFQIVNFRDILINPLDAKGKVVLIGYTSTATDDTVNIPLRGSIPGVYAHASYIYNSINSTGLYAIQIPFLIYTLFSFIILFIPRRYSVPISFTLPLALIIFTSYYLKFELIIINCLVYITLRSIGSVILKSKFLEDIAFKDGLTNIFNRRALDLKALELWTTYSYITLLMIDIDFFKRYNDTYGHYQGDIVLKRVAQALMKIVRDKDKDIVARYGGEEFTIIIFSGVKIPKRRIETICTNINSLINDLDIKHKDSPHNKLTLSIGAISVSSNQQSYEQTLILADEQLYISKSKGRNTYSYRDI